MSGSRAIREQVRPKSKNCFERRRRLHRDRRLRLALQQFPQGLVHRRFTLFGRASPGSLHLVERFRKGFLSLRAFLTSSAVTYGYSAYSKETGTLMLTNELDERRHANGARRVQAGARILRSFHNEGMRFTSLLGSVPPVKTGDPMGSCGPVGRSPGAYPQPLPGYSLFSLRNSPAFNPPQSVRGLPAHR